MITPGTLVVRVGEFDGYLPSGLAGGVEGGGMVNRPPEGKVRGGTVGCIAATPCLLSSWDRSPRQGPGASIHGHDLPLPHFLQAPSPPGRGKVGGVSGVKKSFPAIPHRQDRGWRQAGLHGGVELGNSPLLERHWLQP